MLKKFLIGKFRQGVAFLVRYEKAGRIVRKVYEKTNYYVYKLSGGRIFNSMGDGQIILVKTIGRKTGKEREFPLLSTNFNGNWVIVGSNAGRPDNPAWVANLRATPDISITVGTTVLPVYARELTDKVEYDQAFGAIVLANDVFLQHASHTTRTMPVFLLEPRPLSQ
ncbi:nitroreductase family deazaflavin-dependent oxidoreductase [Rhodococcus sp. MS16]|uniref:nitroreductase/quinone reductase family protein n=1 Tax=Rhodococcus sp. MS16 TaxID=2579941 RepID=UPI001561EF6F|nr:nitroreductase/quinone reductase family protein [Rhodococcus sp. MS16]NRI69835.1 nitroreductase family deazaflavin-dependent oxidoreductase [Rhodococcus sp. MS16]